MSKEPTDKLISPTPVALQMYDVLAEDMETVRELFSAELQSDLPLVNERIGKVGKFRGKMLRPCLVLLCGRACGPVGHSHHVVGAVVEMIHVASLIHDDILDQSQIRRRGATLNALYGNETAVLAGDFLLSHTFSLCSQLKSQRICSMIASTTNMVCEGEIVQVAHKGDWELSEEEYLAIISRKTASLCGTCCRLGVECSAGSAQLAQAMDDFGCALGMAFQITDDVLDILGSEPEMGKTLGRDVLQGKLTLPVIRARDQLSSSGRKELMDLLTTAKIEDLDQIRKMLNDCQAIDSANKTAEEYISRAIEKLTVLPVGTERESLEKIARFVVERHI
jgi:octaprenyl-diphosphate synthase